MSCHHLARAAATAGLAALLILGGVSSASARPDPGEPTWAVQAAPDDNCALRRIGAQLVRCDSLTGAGVRAPSSIPEFGTEVTEAACVPYAWLDELKPCYGSPDGGEANHQVE